MNIFAGSIEIQMLCWSLALGLVQLLISTTLAVQGRSSLIAICDFP